MNPVLKRMLGLTGSLALGLGAAVTFASGAQAHHVEIASSTECADDGWTVTWQVTDWNSHNGVSGSIDAITAEGDLDGDIVDGAPLPHPSSGDTLVATQNVGSDVGKVSLTIDAAWDNGQRGVGSGEAFQPEGGCDAPVEPGPAVTASAESNCLGIEVHATNTNAAALAEITFESSDGRSQTQTPEVDEYFIEFFPISDPERGLSVTVLVDGEQYAVYDWETTGNCDFGHVTETCEGLQFDLEIPEDGTETTYTFTPSDGDKVEATLVPGASETVAFEAVGDELSVHLIVQDGKTFYEDDVEWNRPDDCEEAPSASTSPAAQLPTTGSSMTVLVSAAAALVLVAAVLFVIARRRRAAADW